MKPPRPAPLPASEIHLALASLPGWRHENDTLAKDFVFTDFPSALAWMVRAGFEAEALDHHPEWTNVYCKVSVRLSTHDAGHRVTTLDLTLASRFEKLAPQATSPT